VIIIAQRLFGLTVGSVLTALRPAFFASFGLAVVLLGVHHVIHLPWAAVTTGGVLGAAVYLGLLLLFAPDVLKRLRTIAFAAPAAPSGSAPASSLPD
jgi:hypothetical protein